MKSMKPTTLRISVGVLKKPSVTIKKPACKLAKGGQPDDKWMESADIHKGGLHKSLGIPMGKKIPVKAIKKAEHSSNPKERKQARLAETFRAHNPNIPHRPRGM